MKYLIVETHPGFCVALSEDGRYVKCANLRYSVGEKVEDVVELRAPEAGAGRRRALKIVTPFAALAACLCVAFFGWYQPNCAAYGALRLSINPDVELTLSRSERVLEAEGLNPDGAALLESVELEGLDAEAAADALVAGSIEGGWLREGGAVTVSVTGGSGEWRAETERELLDGLDERYGSFALIRTPDDPVITIPVPPEPTPSPTPPPPPTPAPTPAPTPPPVSDDDDDDWGDDDDDDDYDEDYDDDWDD